MNNVCKIEDRNMFERLRLFQGMLYRRLCRFLPVQMNILNKYNIFLDSKYAITLFAEVFASRAYYPAVELFKESPRVVLDLGAFGGFFTLLVEWNRVQRFPDAKIDYCLYEANPKLIKVIKRNMQMVKLKDNVHIYCGAVGKRSGLVDFAICKNLGFSSVLPVSNVTRRIHTSYIDIVKNLEKDKLGMPELIKIDIEGSELDLFKNYQDLFSKTCVVAAEFHGDAASCEDWQNLVVQTGLQLYEITEKADRSCNLIFFNKQNLERHNSRT